MDTKVLFLSDGEMAVCEHGKVRTLHSVRMQKYIDTTRELENRNAWKYEGAGAQFQQQVNPYVAPRRMAESTCRVTAIAPYGDQLLYALLTPDMGGLYLKSMEDDAAAEGNWLSERGFSLRDMHLQGGQIAFALDASQGECHIALMKAGQTRYQIITQGDTQDTAPFLCPDDRTLYYSSAGYARDEEGRILAKGPAALLKLDLCSGDLDTVYEDAAADYLRPKAGPDGALYFIRRPYEQPSRKPLTISDQIKNVGAFFKGMGKFFQLIGDPEGAKKRQPRVAGQSDNAAQKRLLEGVLVDVTSAKEANAEGDGRGCVPDSWVLMRREPDGKLTEVLKGVADYDFDGDALVYSDGRRIIRQQNEKKTVLHKAVFIPRLVVIK